MSHQCPDCGSALQAARYSGTEVEECPRCAGVWLDVGELRDLIEDSAALNAVESENVPAVEVHEPSAGRDCPKCVAKLQSYHYAYSSPVVLDYCQNCRGIWVQEGELARIEQYRQEGAGSPEDRARAALAVAQYTEDHNRTLARQQRVAGLLNHLRRRPFWRDP